MLCQKCGLAEATVHLETTVYRQKIEEHLCALCAGARAPAAQRIPEMSGRPAAAPVTHASLRAIKTLGKVAVARLRLRAELGREATDEEVATKANLTLKQVKQAATLGARALSGDEAPALQAALSAAVEQALQKG